MVLPRKGHYILLLVGTLLFLAWLLAEPLDGSGGAWDVYRGEADYGVPAGGQELGRVAIQAKHEAIHAKKATIKVGVYLAFVALLLGHALLWPEAPQAYKPTLREVIPPGGQPGRLA